MNKKIKVIELLNKIANKEELPKQIKIYGRNDSIYILRNIKDTEIYYYTNKDTHERLGADWHLDGKILNEYAEILEDEEEIDIKMFEEEWLKEHKLNMQAFDLDLVFKINEVIDKVNKLNKKINKEN